MSYIFISASQCSEHHTKEKLYILLLFLVDCFRCGRAPKAKVHMTQKKPVEIFSTSILIKLFKSSTMIRKMGRK